MEPNPRGGDFLPNNFVQLTLLAFEDVTGANAVKAVLNLGGLTRLVGNFPPPDSEKTFPFQEFTRILSGFEDLYGPRGGRALCHRAGEQTFLAGAKIFGVDSGEHPASLSAGMERVAWYLNSALTADACMEKMRGSLRFSIGHCPACTERWSAVPVCQFFTGFLREAARWSGNGKPVFVTETSCIAGGDEACVFEIFPHPPK
jgi:predicted hydrocarbon binding protein